MKTRLTLVEAAQHLFDLEVDRTLPIGESFSSDVLRFVSNGDNWVIKRPFSLEKAHREAHWLECFDDFSFTPKLVACVEHEGSGYLLMHSIAGMPIGSLAGQGKSTLLDIGKALRVLHSVSVENFDGHVSWRELLKFNANRYQAELKGPLLDISTKALKVFRDNLDFIPEGDHACPVHFDFRPGNILVSEGRFTGIIDFESMRGGHPSMDFFKLIVSGSDSDQASANLIKSGYGDAEWLENIDELIGFYKIYHGLGGLAWCAKRGELDTEFYHQNLQLLKHGTKPYA